MNSDLFGVLGYFIIDSCPGIFSEDAIDEVCPYCGSQNISIEADPDSPEDDISLMIYCRDCEQTYKQPN